MNKTATVKCSAIVDNGETLQTHLIPVNGHGQGIVISFDKAKGETCDFVAGKNYLVRFMEAPVEETAPAAEEAKTEMKAE